ncbi:MAG TPA: NAD(P)/FAD-dependent oxidoreductase [Burkholderiaceae bacterium]|nr:NAD(P)/FAD-dependent oxidoreductase [Burkholderiaceae bacterium]
MDRIDVLVVGAGVVGLAVARALALAGREVVVIEALELVGSVTSARNSEVIHAGLYYPPGSQKARLCVAGKAALYAYCERQQLPHRRCGKLVVANGAAEEAKLEALRAQAEANGVHDTALLTGAEARALEPELVCSAALHSPSTGIVDSHAYMLALRGDAESAGAMVALASPFEGAVVQGDGFEVRVGGAMPMTLHCRALINSAGLQAAQVARRIEGLDPRHVPTAQRCKGHYFALSGRAPFSRLVYPMPDQAGLGIHYTLDLGGQGRFGPDTEWLAGGDDTPIDYTVDASRREAFAGAIARYWPGLRVDALQPAYSGVRPKIVGPGEPAADFLIDGPESHRVAGLVNLFGIESPGLTASLAIADTVVDRLGSPA